MNAEQLKRFLVQRGAGNAAVDAVIRKLRVAFRVQVSGRGTRAHQLDVAEVWWVLACLAGSDTPSRSPDTIRRLINLSSPESRTGTNDFIARVQSIIIAGAREIADITIARNVDFAVIRYLDGGEERYFSPDEFLVSKDISSNFFRSEGVIPGNLLRTVAGDLRATGHLMVRDGSSESSIPGQLAGKKRQPSAVPKTLVVHRKLEAESAAHEAATSKATSE